MDLEATCGIIEIVAEMVAPPEGSRALQLNPKAKPTTTKMKQVIGQVLAEKLDNASYQSDRAAALTKEIADAVKMRLKGGGYVLGWVCCSAGYLIVGCCRCVLTECNFPRFKYVVQVVIGEQRGEGVR